jgi:hypothetical protein
MVEFGLPVLYNPAMAKEGDSSDKLFLVEGTIPDLLSVPDSLMDHRVILQEAARKGEEDFLRQENKNKLATQIENIIAPWGPSLKAMATKRLEHGEFEPKKRREKEKTSKWKGDWKNGWENGFNNYNLVFKTNWRQNKVEEVKSFLMNSRESAVIISLEKGKVSEVAYEFQSPARSLWEIEKESDVKGLWGEWFRDVVIDRKIRDEVREMGQNRRSPRVKDRLTFDASGIKLKYSSFYDPNRAFQVWVGGAPPPKPLDEISDSWDFNADFNRFNHRIDKYTKTIEDAEAEAEAYKESNPTLASFILEEAKKRPPKAAILKPDEFTNGLELLLATIPLE